MTSEKKGPTRLLGRRGAMMSLVGFVLAVALQACAEEGAPEPVQYTVQSQWADRAPWHLEEDLRIRIAEEAGLDRSTAMDLTIGPEGQIVLLDDSTQVVQVFEPDGGFSHGFAPLGDDEPVGRTARGVEFDEEGNLWVLHPGQRFYTVHTLDGERIRTIEREVTGTTFPWMVRFDADGHFHVWGIEVDRSEGLQMSVPFRVSRTDGSILERGEPVVSFLVRSRQGRIIPYRPRTRIAPGDSGGFWYADSDRYTIYERTFDGRIIHAFSLDRPSPPVSQTEHDSIMQRQMEIWSAEEGHLEPDEIPSTKHVVDGIRFDDEGGYLYVFTTLAADEGVKGVDVFTGAGEFLGTLELPEPILAFPTPHVTPDHLYIGVEGEDGAKEIVRLRIVRPESG